MSGLRYLSVCSGIEAATQAWHPLGWTPVAFSEIEPFPSAVLAHHYPTVPNRGDMSKFAEWPDEPVDLLCGGTPCQSFSVAGLRKGLADPRGNLALTYLAIAARYRPCWIVWENVPGVLSSNGGRDFGAFLGGLGQLGYGFAYRVLDAQYVRTRRFPWAVPQRRRRVFVVGYLGDWRRAAAVLFDCESLSGNPPPRRRSGQDLAGALDAGLGDRGAPQGERGHLIAMAHGQAGAEIAYGHGPTLTCNHEAPIVAFDCKGSQVQHDDSGATPTLRAMGHADSHANAGGQLAVAHPFVFMERGRDGGRSLEARADGSANAILTPNGGRSGMGVGAVAYGLTTEQTPKAAEDSALTLTKQSPTGGGQVQCVVTPWAVRRLTPRECERLQGFPDGFTAIPWRGKPADQCPDGPRYKALGNSMAVNVMAWIGERIALVDALREAAA